MGRGGILPVGGLTTSFLGESLIVGGSSPPKAHLVQLGEPSRGLRVAPITLKSLPNTTREIYRQSMQNFQQSGKPSSRYISLGPNEEQKVISLVGRSTQPSGPVRWRPPAPGKNNDIVLGARLPSVAWPDRPPLVPALLRPARRTKRRKEAVKSQALGFTRGSLCELQANRLFAPEGQSNQVWKTACRWTNPTFEID